MAAELIYEAWLREAVITERWREVRENIKVNKREVEEMIW